MALWGRKGTVYSTGTIDVDVSTGICERNTGAIAWVTAGVAVGDVVTVGVNTCEGIITGITSERKLTITLDNLGSDDFSKVAYEIRQKPKYTLHDSNYGVGEIFGVSVAESQTARGASGDARKYKPAAAGWVGITSYTDAQGNFRVKTETLVAGRFIEGDSGDDTILPNS